MVILTFAIQRRSSPMACKDHHGHLHFRHPETIKSDGMRRPSWSSTFIVFDTIKFSFAFQRQLDPLARGDKTWSSAPSPSRDNQVRWHAETIMVNHIHCFRDYYSLLRHPETIKSDGMRRPSWSSTFIVFETIIVSFDIQRQSSLMACGDHHGHLH